MVRGREEYEQATMPELEHKTSPVMLSCPHAPMLPGGGNGAAHA